MPTFAGLSSDLVVACQPMELSDPTFMCGKTHLLIQTMRRRSGPRETRERLGLMCTVEGICWPKTRRQQVDANNCTRKKGRVAFVIVSLLDVRVIYSCATYRL